MSTLIRNKDGLWINTAPFREAAIHFKKYGYYTEYPYGHPLWIDYWKEQMNRCLNGYCVGGACITGYHYFYLNFTRIKKIDPNTKRKTVDFPDFWDWDYNFYWALDIAKNGISKEDYNKLNLGINIHEDDLVGNLNLFVVKARRKGYSWKNASIIAANYNFFKNSLSLIGSYEKVYSKDTFLKTKSIIDFVNKYTGWSKKQLAYTKEGYIKSGFRIKKDGIWIDDGYLSEIKAITYQDNPDPARGSDAMYVALEEAGKFNNLIDSYGATMPVVKDGDVKTGIIVAYGTSINMGDGALALKQMFYSPKEYEAIRIENIWDDNSLGTYVGFFHSSAYNKVNYYDENGNSDIDAAIESEMKIRASKNSYQALQNHIIEYPLKPSEAFKKKGVTYFPVEELELHFKRLLATEAYKKEANLVRLFWVGDEVRYDIILNKTDIDPIYRYKQKIESTDSAVIMYEPPVPNAPLGLYKIGYDPYAQDKGESLAAIYVYKTVLAGDSSRNKIVARYVGRPYDTDAANEIALMLAELYNTQVMYENMFIHVKQYFKQRKKLFRLASQPDDLISKHIKNSRVSRIFGIHMNRQLKDAGIKYLKEWIMTEANVDEDGQIIYNYENVLDIGLIEELIYFNNDDNFDRVMAFMMVMFQIEADTIQEYKSNDLKTEIYKEIQKYKSKRTIRPYKYG